MVNTDGTILLVEDDDGLREAIEDNLELEGYDVVTASDGVYALERIEERRPELIVLDLMLPRMDGFSLVAELKRRELRPGIPIIVLTADGHAAEKAERIGAESWLHKPFDVAALLQQVDRLLTPAG